MGYVQSFPCSKKVRVRLSLVVQEVPHLAIMTIMCPAGNRRKGIYDQDVLPVTSLVTISVHAQMRDSFAALVVACIGFYKNIALQFA